MSVCHFVFCLSICSLFICLPLCLDLNILINCNWFDFYTYQPLSYKSSTRPPQMARMLHPSGVMVTWTLSL